MTTEPRPVADRKTSDSADEVSGLAVRLARLSGRPLEGTPSPLRGRGRLELTEHALVLHYRRPIADLPEWAVGMIVGGSAVYYVLIAYVFAGLLPPAGSGEGGPLVPAMAAALGTWMVVRWLGPARAEQVSFGRSDVGGLLLDAARSRVLLQSRTGQLVGLEVHGSLEPLERYLEERWPDARHDGSIRAPYVGRRATVLLVVVLVVALLLWLAPE